MNQARASVIICAYTFDRLASTIAAARAAHGQAPAPLEVILVVDHNAELQQALATALPDVAVVGSSGPPGLSGARNAGIAAAAGEILVFLDDDAIPQQDWLAGLVDAFADPAVAVVGGRALPDWEGDRPAWFPEEFLWVVGCSYRGQVESGRVRNPIGASMAVRRTALDLVGGFDPAVGRLGRIPLGAEETELSLRVTAADPGARVVMTGTSVVSHRVPRDRQRPGYFLRRCFYEGVSKAQMARLAGSGSLDTERGYVRSVLPRGFGSAVAAAVSGPARMASAGRAFAIAGGLAVTVLGYLVGRVAPRLGRGYAVASERAPG